MLAVSQQNHDFHINMMKFTKMFTQIIYKTKDCYAIIYIARSRLVCVIALEAKRCTVASWLLARPYTNQVSENRYDMGQH